MGVSPFPVIAGAWDGGVCLILVVGEWSGGPCSLCGAPRSAGVGLGGPAGWPYGMAVGTSGARYIY